jgi:hypothetical protein
MGDGGRWRADLAQVQCSNVYGNGRIQGGAVQATNHAASPVAVTGPTDCNVASLCGCGPGLDGHSVGKVGPAGSAAGPDDTGDAGSAWLVEETFFRELMVVHLSSGLYHL